jgi:hypothetical protein
VLNVGGTISDGPNEGMFRGPSAHWADELTALAVDHGFDTFLLWGEGEHDLPCFANEVVPAVRAEVARSRGADRR